MFRDEKQLINDLLLLNHPYLTVINAYLTKFIPYS